MVSIISIEKSWMLCKPIKHYILMDCLFLFSLLYPQIWRQWHPSPVLLPGKSHGWRSLAGCSPWQREESDMTERLPFHFSLSCIGEGNGNPLQCSFLENPRNGGIWWASVYGVAQSRTGLKWLSSSSSHIKIHLSKTEFLNFPQSCLIHISYSSSVQ